MISVFAYQISERERGEFRPSRKASFAVWAGEGERCTESRTLETSARSLLLVWSRPAKQSICIPTPAASASSPTDMGRPFYCRQHGNYSQPVTAPSCVILLSIWSETPEDPTRDIGSDSTAPHLATPPPRCDTVLQRGSEKWACGR